MGEGPGLERSGRDEGDLSCLDSLSCPSVSQGQRTKRPMDTYFINEDRMVEVILVCGGRNKVVQSRSLISPL